MESEEAVMGIFISLYNVTQGMRDEARKAGMYKNNLFNTQYPKLQIVCVQDILDGRVLQIPVVEVVKKAEHKGKRNKGQSKLEL